jgi:hypothetical protein
MEHAFKTGLVKVEINNKIIFAYVENWLDDNFIECKTLLNDKFITSYKNIVNWI